MIVTSSLFNEQQQQQKQQNQQRPFKSEDTPEDEEEFFVNNNKSLVLRIFGASAVSVIISIITLTQFNIVLLLPCWISLYIATCYILYKHHVIFTNYSVIVYIQEINLIIYRDMCKSDGYMHQHSILCRKLSLYLKKVTLFFCV